MSMKHISDVQVCRAIAEYRSNGLPFADHRLAAMTGQPYKVCYNCLERAYNRGLIECGVSVRGGWLTAKGKELLANATETSA